MTVFSTNLILYRLFW